MTEHKPEFDWTGEAVATLEKLAGLGLTAQEIGTRIGVSKNSALAKIKRMSFHWPHTKTPQRVAARTKPQRKAKAPKPVLAGQNPIPLLKAGFSQCRWPMWGDEGGAPEFLVCGDATDGIMSSWCPGHALRISPKPGPKPASGMPVAESEAA